MDGNGVGGGRRVKAKLDGNDPGRFCSMAVLLTSASPLHSFETIGGVVTSEGKAFIVRRVRLV